LQQRPRRLPHSRDDGWKALSNAVLNAGFVVVNSHPVKSEMSVATPKAQAKEPIQLDIIIVCKKADKLNDRHSIARERAMGTALDKMRRLQASGFSLSLNDKKIVLFGQLLTTLTSPEDIDLIVASVRREMEQTPAEKSVLLSAP